MEARFGMHNSYDDRERERGKTCIVCKSDQLEYYEDHCRNVCLRCNSMQELSNYTISSFDRIPGVKYKYLRSVQIGTRRKATFKKLDQIRKEQIKPFKLEEMFHWIFEKQVESMRPFVPDWDNFRSVSELLWRLYLKRTGSDFDIAQASMDEIDMTKYPLGWGVPLDPKRGAETMMITPREFFRRRKRRGPVDPEKLKRNSKKLQIEKMVLLKTREKSPAKAADSDEWESRCSSRDAAEDFQLSSASESPLSDESDPDYVELFDLKKAQRNAARKLRKRKEHEVRYTGGGARRRQLLMENNLLLLFFSLYLTAKRADCCCLMDVLALARSGAVPYLKMSRFLPSDYFFLNHSAFQALLLRDGLLSYRKMRQCGFFLAATLELDTLLRVDLEPLLGRLLRQLNLPGQLKNLIDYVRAEAERTLDRTIARNARGAVLHLEGKMASFKKNLQYVLFYEVHCLAYIFTALRMLLRLDGAFELEVSELTARLDGAGVCGTRLFAWSAWLREMHVPPSVSTARTWADVARAPGARRFLGEGGQADLPLARNRLVNAAGRFVQHYKAGTHEEALGRLLRPLARAVVAEEEEATVVTDMTGHDIRPLVEPLAFWHRVTDSTRRTGGLPHDLRQALDRLTHLLHERPLAYTRLPLNCLRYPHGVFADVLAQGCLTSSETRLLRIVEGTFGVDGETLYRTAAMVDKALMKAA